jgi:hypothetical protein
MLNIIRMIIVFKLITELGEFVSEEMSVTKEQYLNLVDLSKTFYNGGYDMWLPDGFIVASSEVIKRSILKIEILKKDD